MSAALIGSSLIVDDASFNKSEYLLVSPAVIQGILPVSKRAAGDYWRYVQLNSFDGTRRPRSSAKRDVVVLACANQLGPHTDLGHFAKHLEKMASRSSPLELGRSSAILRPQGHFDRGDEALGSRFCRAHTPTDKPNIGVRGEFSRHVLEDLGLGDRASITGCPSNFINFDPGLPEKLERKYKTPKLSRSCRWSSLLA